jgi:hypothetical protein
MKSTKLLSGLWTASFGEIGASLKALQDCGVTVEDLARLRSEPSYAKRVAEFMLRGGIEGSVHQKLVRAILGKNFFGVEEWSVLYGLNFSKKQFREISEFPWNEDILNSTCLLCGKIVRECHFGHLGLEKFKGVPLTMMKLYELHPRTGQPRFYLDDPWYKNEEFATKTTLQFRWYLTHLEIVPNSENKTYERQTQMLTEDYEVPSAIEETVKSFLYYKKNGIYLNPTRYARCRDLGSDGRRVYLGLFDSGGFHVCRWYDDEPDGHIGLASSRKFSKS